MKSELRKTTGQMMPKKNIKNTTNTTVYFTSDNIEDEDVLVFFFPYFPWPLPEDESVFEDVSGNLFRNMMRMSTLMTNKVDMECKGQFNDQWKSRETDQHEELSKQIDN